MLRQIVDLNPAEPARLGFSVARGQRFACAFLFQAPASPNPGDSGIGDYRPQLILRPRSRPGAAGYDLSINGEVGMVEIDGAALQDPNGYTVELYARDENLRPTALLASGAMVMTGGAYAYEGPLGPMTLPVVEGPPGPAGNQGQPGVQGEQGTRGSMWFSGHGTPTIIGEVVGDMWLDVDTGDVWRWGGLGSWERN
jgi:hypothetical protein